MTQDPVPRTKRRSNWGWKLIALVTGILLCFANVIAWYLDDKATTDLNEMQAASRERNQIEALRQGRGRMQDVLSLQIASFRRPEMMSALRGAIESTQLADMLLCRTGDSYYSDESWYLCPPDDSQVLVIKIKTTENPSPLNPIGKGGSAKVIELPLNARTLHEIRFGSPRGSRSRFRVAFDNREMYSASWEGYRGGSTSSFHVAGHSGLIQPGTLQVAHQDYGEPLANGDWRLISSKAFTLSRGKDRKQIGITVGLRTKGEMYVSEQVYLSAARDLRLQWDPELMRYRILGPKNPNRPLALPDDRRLQRMIVAVRLADHYPSMCRRA